MRNQLGGGGVNPLRARKATTAVIVPWLFAALRSSQLDTCDGCHCFSSLSLDPPPPEKGGKDRGRERPPLEMGEADEARGEGQPRQRRGGSVGPSLAPMLPPLLHGRRGRVDLATPPPSPAVLFAMGKGGKERKREREIKSQKDYTNMTHYR
ncbi:Os01g0592950 [Oryza sativa Japonica Group]|uniref:Os01g0592950 protein n=1 Tax=Oryza sativa subsp. japonica TaxID=39947 RepID=A0A0N7KD91_ORYSJ|nr:Os01g0592950 [Oryza sativa Japonica Group]